MNKDTHKIITQYTKDQLQSVVIPVTKGTRIGHMQENSFIFLGVSSLRTKEKCKKFCVWRSAGIYWEELIFVCCGGESFKDVFIFTVLSTVLQDEERMKIFM